MERKFNLDTNNFIAIADGYIPDQECDNAIIFFDHQYQLGRYYDRLSSEGASVTAKKDVSYNLNRQTFTEWHSQFKGLLANFKLALNEYYKQTGVLESLDIKDLHFTSIKIQKTEPAGGYHLWHVEKGAGFDYRDRALVYIIYLNDIEDGGETEFLHQKIRVKPKKGRIVIWPSGFPYVHRGNPPLKENKYIITSWLLNI